MESNWNDLMSDSIGGGQNSASAYCLIYVDQTKYAAPLSRQKSSLENDLNALPIDLQDYVKADNSVFDQELQVNPLDPSPRGKLFGAPQVNPTSLSRLSKFSPCKI